jgi:hypothetical protein
VSRRLDGPPGRLVPPLAFKARAEEIVAAWDQWQAEQEAAKEREGVAEADARRGAAFDNFHEIGHRIAAMPAKTMAGVIAKLLAAAPLLNEDDLDDDTRLAIVAGAALNAAALQA